MKSKLSALSEKFALTIICLTFAAPLMLAVWFQVTPNKSSGTNWLRNITLAGIHYELKQPKLTIRKLLATKFQNEFAANYNHSFCGRELILRTVNELFFRVFNVSSLVEIGPAGNLFLRGDLLEYTTIRIDAESIRPQVVELRQFQDICDARRIPFAVMITPNKAAIYPELMPDRWKRRFKPGLRRYDCFVSLLKEYGVRYVDGHQITLDLKGKSASQLFPVGGIHWGDESAFATTSALLHELVRQGLPVESNIETTIRITDHPADMQDRDLVLFLNIVTEPLHPVAEVSIERKETKNLYRPNAVFVGGSFDWKVLRFLDATGQFSELDFYDYYTASKNCQTNGKVHELARPTPKVDFATEIYAADAIVIESNEEVPALNNHVSRFLHDALAAAPASSDPKAPYHYVGTQSYKWGDDMIFVMGPHATNPAGLTGFTDVSDIGTFTIGPVATVNLQTPGPPPGDMVLTLEGYAFLDAAHLPEQRAEVLVNGHHLVQWTWKLIGPLTHEVLVPKNLLAGDSLTIEFRIAKPSAPADFGVNSDARKLGMLLRKIRIHEPAK